MKKKEYIIPTIGRIPMLAATLLAGSGGAEQGVDENGSGTGGPTGGVDKDNTGTDESDSKRFNAWSSWDE